MTGLDIEAGKPNEQVWIELRDEPAICDQRLTALRSAALMRACHPAPLARKASITSWSSRKVTWRLGAAPTGGRPIRVSVPLAGRMTLPPSRISARSKNSAVSSGASSGSIQSDTFNLLPVGMPHRNDAKHSVAVCMDDHDRPAIESPISDPSLLTVVLPIINLRVCPAGKHIGDIEKIKPAFPQRRLALDGIELNLHRDICSYTKARVQVQSGLPAAIAGGDLRAHQQRVIP